MRILPDVQSLFDAVDEPLGHSAWTEVTQARIDAFAEVTGDHQWIHVDPVRAATTAFGGTIAHGYLTLSLIPSFIADVYRIDAGSARLNYGLEKVRFPAPVKASARVRGSATIARVESLESGTQVTFRWTLEVEGQPRPACIAETITLVID